jgi:hypothetical protein
MKIRRTTAALCIVLSSMATVDLAAIERKPLPPLEWTAIDGARVTSAQIVRQGRWLLLYLEPGCTQCESLLRLVDPANHPALPARIVVVVGGVDASGIAASAQKFPNLAGARWVADQSRSTLNALKLPGAPVILGLQQQMIEWSLAGVLGDSSDVRSVMTSWVSR